MTVAVAADALATPLRLLSNLTDAIASLALQHPTRLRVHTSTVGLLAGRADRVTATIRDVHIGGLDLASVHVDARAVAMRPGRPPRLHTAATSVRVTVRQDALDRWMLADALPFRVRLRRRGLALRLGAAGVRMAEVGAEVAVEHDRLVLTPRGAEVLRVAVPAIGVRLPLPIPPLPRGSRLTAVDIDDDQITIGLHVDRLDEPLDLDVLRRSRRLLAPAQRAIGSDAGEWKMDEGP